MASGDEDILANKLSDDVKHVSDSDPSPDKVENEEENSSRMNSAKAFFRAMYAGDDVKAGQYGMNVETVKSNGTRGTCASCDLLSTQVEQLEAKYIEMEGLYKRMAADFENFRKRVDREKEELTNLGVQKGVYTLLPALDDLDRAQTSFTHNSDVAHIIESLKLIGDRFTKCLEQLGVKSLNPVGQPFDPRLHEPVQQVAAPHLPEGAVAHDLRRGYAMGEKVIRPTLVNVVSNEVDSVNDSGAETIVVLANVAHVVQEVLAETKLKNIIVTEVGDLFPFPKSLLVNLIIKYSKKT